MLETMTKEARDVAWDALQVLCANLDRSEEAYIRSELELLVTQAVAGVRRVELRMAKRAARHATLKAIQSTRELRANIPDEGLSLSNPCPPEYRRFFAQLHTTVETIVGKGDAAKAKSESPGDPEESVMAMLQQFCASEAAEIKRLIPPMDSGEISLALMPPAAIAVPGEAAFPRCWEILAYLVPKKDRQRVYDPARSELLEDFVLSRALCKTRWSRMAVNGVFFVRTMLLAGECLRVLMSSRVVQSWLSAGARVLGWIARLTGRSAD